MYGERPGAVQPSVGWTVAVDTGYGETWTTVAVRGRHWEDDAGGEHPQGAYRARDTHPWSVGCDAVVQGECVGGDCRKVEGDAGVFG